jgi:hypothetical protein
MELFIATGRAEVNRYREEVKKEATLQIYNCDRQNSSCNWCVEF